MGKEPVSGLLLGFLVGILVPLLVKIICDIQEKIICYILKKEKKQEKQAERLERLERLEEMFYEKNNQNYDFFYDNICLIKAHDKKFEKLEEEFEKIKEELLVYNYSWKSDLSKENELDD